jgi:hypothetical protein
MVHKTADVEILQGEVLPLSIDISAVLQAGEVVQSVVATLTEQTAQALIADGIEGTPSVTDTTLNVTVDGRELTPTDRYTLKVLMTIEPNAKVVGTRTTVLCRA